MVIAGNLTDFGRHDLAAWLYGAVEEALVGLLPLAGSIEGTSGGAIITVRAEVAVLPSIPGRP